MFVGWLILERLVVIFLLASASRSIWFQLANARFRNLPFSAELVNAHSNWLAMVLILQTKLNGF